MVSQYCRFQEVYRHVQSLCKIHGILTVPIKRRPLRRKALLSIDEEYEVMCTRMELLLQCDRCRHVVGLVVGETSLYPFTGI